MNACSVIGVEGVIADEVFYDEQEQYGEFDQDVYGVGRV